MGDLGVLHRGAMLDDAQHHQFKCSAKETIAVSMSHKAYAFDWSAFARDELHSILLDALSSGDTNGLIRYIEANQDHLKNHYEGGPLSNWRDMLENFDVQEFGDFALTRFYDPEKDSGLGNDWLAIDEHLSEADRAVLLGTPFGSSSAYFDPGLQGSYFQTPREVVRSFARVQRIGLSDLEDYRRQSLERFKELLEECAVAGSGLYVTF
jgi:hypothetical protein